jgi:hypothetical protein
MESFRVAEAALEDLEHEETADGAAPPVRSGE